MTAALPTPETLRERAAAALVAADRDATNTLYDGPSKEVVHRSAVARAAYARELLTIAAQLEPAPSTAAPAETHPRRGDLYRHTSTGDEWVVCALDAEWVYLAGARPCGATVKPWTVTRERFAAEMERAS